MKKILIVGALTWILTGCVVDPMGATTRTQIRADAVVGIERERARAVIESEESRQSGATTRAALMAGALPVVLVIAGATVILSLVVNWQGRIHLERTRQGYTQGAHAQQLPSSQVVYWRQIARAHGATLQLQGDRAWLQLPNGTRKQLPMRGD